MTHKHTSMTRLLHLRSLLGDYFRHQKKVQQAAANCNRAYHRRNRRALRKWDRAVVRANERFQRAFQRLAATGFLDTGSLITVHIQTQPNGDVDSRAYIDGKPVIVPDGAGKPYHAGQISSSIDWAIRDMREHFKDDWDRLFPDGWRLEFCVGGTRPYTDDIDDATPFTLPREEAV